MSIHVGRVSALDGPTDGQICHNRITLCMHCMLTRDKECCYIYKWCYLLIQVVVILDMVFGGSCQIKSNHFRNSKL